MSIKDSIGLILGRDLEAQSSIKKAQAAIERVLEDHGCDAVERLFAHIVQRRRREMLVSQLHVKETNVHPVLHKVLSKSLKAEREGWKLGNPSGYGIDHPEMFRSQEGSEDLVFVSQPYSLSWEDLRNMVDIARLSGLKIRVDARGSWWFPGKTLAVIWERAAGDGQHSED